MRAFFLFFCLAFSVRGLGSSCNIDCEQQLLSSADNITVNAGENIRVYLGNLRLALDVIARIDASVDIESDNPDGLNMTLFTPISQLYQQVIFPHKMQRFEGWGRRLYNEQLTEVTAGNMLDEPLGGWFYVQIDNSENDAKVVIKNLVITVMSRQRWTLHP